MAAYQCLNCHQIERGDEDCCENPDLFCINDMPGEIVRLRTVLKQPAASGEPDMRHPKIQALIGGKARREIELRLVEQLLDDPDCDLTSMDMEYWHGLHDKLREKLLAAPQPVPAPADALEALRAMLAEAVDRLKAAPQPAPARVPLTEAQIDNAVLPLGFGQLSPREVARAIEAAHGILPQKLKDEK